VLSKRISATIIDLSNNRFGVSALDSPGLLNAYSALNELLDNKDNLYRYVVICENPIASYDHYEFFDRLSNESLRKLIWIPKYWVEGKNWELMISDEDARKTVREIHKTYFEQ
jgi:hypothetical protein